MDTSFANIVSLNVSMKYFSYKITNQSKYKLTNDVFGVLCIFTIKKKRMDDYEISKKYDDIQDNLFTCL